MAPGGAMADGKFRCAACRKLHRRRVPGQRYCGADACQRERRNAWRRERYATDDVYRVTARESTRAWLEAQGGAACYYRRYREKRKKRRRCEDKMPSEQPRRGGNDAPNETDELRANSNAKGTESIVTTGKYLLVPAERANSDAIIVQLLLITDDSLNLQRTTHFSESSGDER
jgi:hypothetical protein